MLVEIVGAADGLASIVDDEGQPLLRRQHFLAERFDTRRVPQVEAVDLEAVGPLAEIRRASVPSRRVARKSSSDDQACARAKELHPRLVADFHAAAGEQGDASAQGRELRALCEILLGAGQAQTVVEVVDGREFLLADVALPRVFRFWNRIAAGEQLLRFRRIDVRRRYEHWLATKLPNSG